eukprot:366095-Chlamydomonas_euryale.AAC.16
MRARAHASVSMCVSKGVCVVLQLWTAQPPLAEWIRRGQPAHTPPQRPPGAERKGRHKGCRVSVRDSGSRPTKAMYVLSAGKVHVHANKHARSYRQGCIRTDMRTRECMRARKTEACRHWLLKSRRAAAGGGHCLSAALPVKLIQQPMKGAAGQQREVGIA